jgi:hypothetical protein
MTTQMIKVKRHDNIIFNITPNNTITTNNVELEENDFFSIEQHDSINTICTQLSNSESDNERNIADVISILYNSVITLHNQLKTTTVHGEKKEFKQFPFEVPIDLIMRCLSSTSISGDILLFKYCYIDNVDVTLYAIKYYNKKYYYWFNNIWNTDIKGTFIKNTLVTNLSSLYFDINNIDNFSAETMNKNQIYISNMDTEKYKNNLLLEIRNFITIDNLL